MSDDIAGSLDIDVVGLPDMTEFKSEGGELFDFDTGNDYGLFGDDGDALQQPAPLPSPSPHCTATACASGSAVPATATPYTSQYAASHAACAPASTFFDGVSTSVASSNIDLPSTVPTRKHSRPCPAIKKNSHWTLMEKDLFHKGLDMIGPNWSKLARFISTKTPSQIKSYHRTWSETANVIPDSMDEFASSCVLVPSSSGLDMLLDDPSDILGMATTTIKTTPPSPSQHHKHKHTSKNLVDYILSAQEETSSKFNVSNSVSDFTASLDTTDTSMKNVGLNDLAPGNSSPFNSADFVSGSEDWVIGSHVSIGGPETAVSPVHLSQTNIINIAVKKRKIRKSSKKLSTLKDILHRNTKRKKIKRNRKGPISNINILEPKVPFSESNLNHFGSQSYDNRLFNMEGQVIKLSKDQSTEDSDVDIDISDDEQLLIVDKVDGNCPPIDRLSSNVEQKHEHTNIPSADDVNSSPVTENKSPSQLSCKDDLPIATENDKVIFTFPPPLEEFLFDPTEINDEEKKVHFEYFDNKGVKTPQRYLKIRNSIINVWRQNKPKYAGKTSVRTYLKNCGDVNYIGKIHEYLEKKGAINFGCASTNYDSPLVILNTKVRAIDSARRVQKIDRSNVIRQKRNKLRIGLTDGGGLTIRHDDSGAVVDACHIPEAPRYRVSSEGKSGHKKNEQFKLIKCLDYDNNFPAPFTVVLHPQSIATMDLHAHASVAEVMGLVGGYFDPIGKTVHITVAVPTKAMSSGVECDMCPVSQSDACIKVQECGVEVVGWYHSHPTFPPNPSLQDIETQSTMQEWFARKNSPLIGVILSPFCPTNRTESSHIQCLILDKSSKKSADNTTDISHKHPYRLKWEVNKEEPNEWTDSSKDIRAVVSGGNDFGVGVEWRKEWKGNLTYWEKAMRSLELLLPRHMTEFVSLVRQAFMAAIRDHMDGR